MDARTLTQQNYDKLDRMADMIEPLGEILGDREAMAAWRDGRRAAALRALIVGHRAAVVRLLAAFEGKAPEAYALDGGVLLVKLVYRFNELQELANALFPSRAQNAGGASSGPVTENTEGVAQ